MPPLWRRLRLESLEPWIALGLAVVLSIILMATSDTSVTQGSRIHLAGLVQLFARPFNAIPTMMSLRSENSRLRTENAHLKMASQGQQETARENERLRRLLDFRTQSHLNLVATEVVGKNPLPGVHSLLLNVGSTAGVRRHMAVINDLGLVGQVVRVGGGTAVAQLLTDRNIGVAVRLSDSRADGITSWAGGDRFLITGILKTTTVHLGEAVITSGLDGVFPAGISVGEVVRTEKTPESFFLEIEMKPAVDFSTLEDVFIVWDSSSRPTP